MVMGGGKPRAQGMYETMRDSRGTGHYSVVDDDMVNVDLQASAHQIDCAAAAQERAVLNGFPGLATDFLVDWERGLGRSPDPNESAGERRATLDAIQAGNGEPTAANILNAISKILPNETVTLYTTLANPKTFITAIAFTPPTLSQQPGGTLAAGAHTVQIAVERANGDIAKLTNNTSITLTTASKSILVAPVSLTAIETGGFGHWDMVHYYLSPSSGSTLTSYVVTNGGGGGMLLGHYPTTPENALPVYHICIIVSTAVYANEVAMQKIDAILGPMLSAWTTYTIAPTRGFVVMAAPNSGSLLGEGAF